jgi:hypothetical protein
VIFPKGFPGVWRVTCQRIFLRNAVYGGAG